jgi:predicted nuclease of restriction endonuclease-like (RecB) superfamily
MAKKRTSPKTTDSKPADVVLAVDYGEWLTSLKQRIRSTRQRALLAANDEQIRLYHDIGREILDRQREQGWGAKVIDRLSADLRAAFPEMKGFSSRNLKYMKIFAQDCPDLFIGQQSAAQLPWFHIIAVLTKLSEPALRGMATIRDKRGHSGPALLMEAVKLDASSASNDALLISRSIWETSSSAREPRCDRGSDRQHGLQGVAGRTDPVFGSHLIADRGGPA